MPVVPIVPVLPAPSKTVPDDLPLTCEDLIVTNNQLQQAWNLLANNFAWQDKADMPFVEQLGLSAADELDYLDDEQRSELAAYLKPIQAKKFLSYFN
jgi:hypothetical protein